MGKIYQNKKERRNGMGSVSAPQNYSRAIDRLLEMCQDGSNLVSTEYLGQIRLVKGHIDEILAQNGIEAN